jgi:hypothetical protein
MFVFHADRLWFVLPAVLLALLLLDGFIWRVNLAWVRAHGRARHPYAPAFTAAGVLVLLAGLAFLIPAAYVGVLLGAFVLGGGLMWLLHARRWWMRGG